MPNFDFIVQHRTGFEKLYEFIFYQRNSEVPKLSTALFHMLRLVPVFSMFDCTNPLIILFTPELSSALGDCTAVHFFDFNLLLIECLTLVCPLFENHLPLSAFTTTWCHPKCSILQSYEKTFKIDPTDLVHAYLIPTKELNDFVKSFCGAKITYKARGRLKVLRIVRIVIRYAKEKNLQLPNSYKNSIYRTDDVLKKALNVNYFHAMDVPAIVQFRCSEEYALCSRPKCKTK